MPSAKIRAENPEHWNEVQRRWRSRNLEKARAAARKWYHENKNEPDFAARLRLADRAKKARRRAMGGKFTQADVAARFDAQRGRCAACRARLKSYHIDHITPLAKGGANIPANIQLLCPPCNMSKGATDPVDFMKSRGFLI
jgi:5-methylcytosine-specific restriction endonuclease McrA